MGKTCKIKSSETNQQDFPIVSSLSTISGVSFRILHNKGLSISAS